MPIIDQSAGIIEGMSMDAYKANPAISASDLKNMQRSPAFAHMRRKAHSVSTAAQEWGTAIHTAILEPHTLGDRYPVDPESPKGGYPAGWRNTKEYKSEKFALLDRPGVVGLLTPDQHESLGWIQKRVAENKIGASLHDLTGIREGSFFAWDDEFDLWRKCRPDWYIEHAYMAVDVKSAADHRERPFARACINFGYHVTAAWYLDTMSMSGHSVDHYPFLVINSDAPHEVATYTLDEDSIEQGRFEYRKLLAEWKDCEQLGKWPAGSSEIKELRLPEYAINYHQERYDV